MNADVDVKPCGPARSTALRGRTARHRRRQRLLRWRRVVLSGCDPSPPTCTDERARAADVPAAAMLASLDRGSPTALAEG